MYDKSNHVLGNASWDWTGGVYTNFSYKNISLSAVFDVKVGAMATEKLSEGIRKFAEDLIKLEKLIESKL
jgi:hypothetical protein